MSGAESEQEKAGTSDIPLSVEGYHCELPESCLGHRYHLHSTAGRVDVSGGRLGLVFPVCCELGDGPDFGDAFRPRSF
jgi:hypothetical protein